jgi:hypothetical protein
MCFSATASFTAGATLSVLGIATLTQTRSKSEILLASFPLLFAVQQYIEGAVWLTIDVEAFDRVNSVSTYVFLFFATVIWPVLCPLSVYFVERRSDRRRAMVVLTLSGGGIGVYLFSFIFAHGVSPDVFSGNLLYDLRFIPGYELVKYLYLAVTVVPFLIAADGRLKAYGVLIIVSFGIAELFYNVTMVSVWCLFAAVLSGGLYLVFRDIKLKVLEVSAVHRDAPRGS